MKNFLRHFLQLSHFIVALADRYERPRHISNVPDGKHAIRAGSFVLKSDAFVLQFLPMWDDGPPPSRHPRWSPYALSYCRRVVVVVGSRASRGLLLGAAGLAFQISGVWDLSWMFSPSNFPNSLQITSKL